MNKYNLKKWRKTLGFYAVSEIDIICGSKGLTIFSETASLKRPKARKRQGEKEKPELYSVCT